MTTPNLSQKFSNIQKVLLNEYKKRHNDPWIIAYSGGKDSSLLLHLVWEMLVSLKPDERNREIHIASSDTLVESPLVISHLKDSLNTIDVAAKKNKLPIYSHLTKPSADQSFWVNVIGRGYIPPSQNFRWCTNRLKIIPTDNLLKKLVIKNNRAILLIGSRMSESETRKRTMKKYNVKANKMNPHKTIKGCRMFSPIADLTTDDVWTILMQRKPPWGGTHRRLITLYKNAGGGECPLVLTKDDAPSCGTSSPRFGCWTCTVVSKDRSMRGTIDAGHKDEEKLEALYEFRERLVALRDNVENRMNVRRDGTIRVKQDGTRVNGPFKMEIRKQILIELQNLENEINEQLISDAELDFINDVWQEDELHIRARSSVLNLITTGHA